MVSKLPVFNPKRAWSVVYWYDFAVGQVIAEGYTLISASPNDAKTMFDQLYGAPRTGVRFSASKSAKAFYDFDKADADIDPVQFPTYESWLRASLLRTPVGSGDVTVLHLMSEPSHAQYNEPPAEAIEFKMEKDPDMSASAFATHIVGFLTQTELSNLRMRLLASDAGQKDCQQVVEILEREHLTWYGCELGKHVVF